MYATRLCAALLAAMTSMLLVAARPASAETFTIDFFPDDTQINNTIQLRFLGPNTGQITQTRLFIDFTTAAGFDAADLTLLLVAPVSPDDPDGGFWFLTGEDLGWSGQGTFSKEIATTMVNGQLNPGLWGFDLGSVLDPPAYSGGFSATTRFEVDIVIPEPAGMAALGGTALLLVQRKRRPR